MMENENQTPTTGGSSKLSTIFIVVLALHIVIIMVIGAYHLVKGNQNPVVAEEEQQPQQENTVNGFENEQTETAKTENNEVSSPVIERGTVEMANQGIQLNEAQPATPVVQTPAAPAPVLDQQPVAARPNPTTITEQQAKQQPVVNTPAVVAATPAATKTTTSQVGTYKVAKGDTLSKIARNNKTTVKQLRELNNLKNDNLKIGQALKVPGASTVAEVVKTAPVVTPAVKVQSVSTPVAANNGNVKVYEVVKGDTLMKIARNHNTTAKAIADMNGVQDPTKIKIGTKLKIPSNELQASSPAAQTQNSNAQAASEVQQINMRPVGGSDMAMLRQPENL
jgi:LysM repeat protein